MFSAVILLCKASHTRISERLSPDSCQGKEKAHMNKWVVFPDKEVAGSIIQPYKNVLLLAK